MAISFRFSRAQLKWVVMLCMLCDHFAAVFLDKDTIGYQILRLGVGRIAFPVFCVLFVEGFFYVRNRWRHLVTLVCFACVSELCFDLALNPGTSLIEFGHQNVMWTWALGFLLLCTLEAMGSVVYSSFMTWFLPCCVIFSFGVLAEVVRVDYGLPGMLCVGFVYLLQKRGVAIWLRTLMTAIILCACYLTPGVFLAVLLVLLYDPKKSGKRQKWLFYWFYPVHLGVLAILRRFL